MPVISLTERLANRHHGRRPNASAFEVTTSGKNIDRAGIGSSPVLGDYATTCLRIEESPTDQNEGRYLLRALTYPVPIGFRARLFGLRIVTYIFQYVYNNAGARKPIILPVTTPDWAFPDGNVSFHLTLTPLLAQAPAVRPATVPPVPPLWTRDYYGQSTGLLYTDPVNAGRYAPPWGGRPNGRPLGDYGLIHDVNRFPWFGTGYQIDEDIPGGNLLNLWVSVRQGNPDTRQAVTLSDAQVAACGPEDRFLQAFPRALYYGVGASMLIETGPLNQEDREEPPCPA